MDEGLTPLRGSPLTSTRMARIMGDCTLWSGWSTAINLISSQYRERGNTDKGRLQGWNPTSAEIRRLCVTIVINYYSHSKYPSDQRASLMVGLAWSTRGSQARCKTPVLVVHTRRPETVRQLAGDALESLGFVNRL